MISSLHFGVQVHNRAPVMLISLFVLLLLLIACEGPVDIGLGLIWTLFRSCLFCTLCYLFQVVAIAIYNVLTSSSRLLLLCIGIFCCELLNLKYCKSFYSSGLDHIFCCGSLHVDLRWVVLEY
jgi:hypothetical protein